MNYKKIAKTNKNNLMKSGFFIKSAGFTLIELLIVIGILAVLATVAVLLLNPAQMIAEGRDSTRLNDLQVLNKAINLSNVTGSIIDSTDTRRVYLSLPDVNSNPNDDCRLDYPTLPALAVNWEYRCVSSSANLRNVDGTGWLPVNFSSVPSIQPPLSVLPVDPVNNTGNYYAYGYDSAKENYAIASIMDSEKYRNTTAVNDGGNWDIAYETRPVGWVAPFVCGGTVNFTYKGSSVTYGTVLSTGSKCWLNRNLGASQVATAYNDSAAYGDLFQWGREDDLHQVRSPAPGTVEGDMSLTAQPGHSNFIIEETSPYDWATSTWITRWTVAEDDPCPAGWRVPTYAELDAELESWSQQDWNGAFASPLKLTAGGYRDYDCNGSLCSVGSFGAYWSSTVFGTFAYHLYFGSGSAGVNYRDRQSGFSVRCLKD